jgi:hypothetical protein
VLFERVRPVAQALEPSYQHGLEQGCLGREVAEDGSDAHAGNASDLFGRGGLASAAEDIVGRVEDAAPVRKSVRAERFLVWHPES